MKDVSLAYGDRAVLEQVSLTVRPGGRAGVIGDNGSGKSTLLRLLAGDAQPDTGEITVSFPGGVGHLGQTPDLDPGDTVQDAVDAALAELRGLEARIRLAEAALATARPDELDAYGELLTAYEERGGYQADARVDAALHGLGLAHLTRDRTLGSLSGGERARLSLACVLAAAPELLLLDEPTNHLDQQATAWLEAHLKAHRGTLVVVTHDRELLEAVTSDILEVDRDLRTVTRYGDGWQGYRTAKAAARRRWAQDHEEWRADVARTAELAESAGRRLAGTGKDPHEGFGKHRRSHEAKLSGQVRAARQRLARLRRHPVPPPPVPLRFGAELSTYTDEAGHVEGCGHPDGPGSATGCGGTDGSGNERGESADRLLAELTGITVGDRLRLDGLTVAPGERLLVTGPNGAGKTTLLRVLAGDLRPDTGTVRRPARTGYLPQEPSVVPSRRSLLAAFAAGLPGPPDEHAPALLSLGLFREDDLTVPVAALSVGQRRRLELARLVTRPADLLVLDEPTNHLALGLVEELEEALSAYRGAVVVVSHDRRFRRGFRGRTLELDGGRAVREEAAGSR
ncbi:ABC transporter ATP-binding protein [Streptomyces albofaciens JCM 4342]|uniref:ABC-F family ATP-binding cassette domain-containing protein n=1 Tax=Streptomyces albofaciens TaxID=66866 RepID=UPI00123BD4E6|nr:ABC-F family ATP-binding cassette domain-containing protein [Streptomyces albofaciens]KAA6223400.1 ABC transporter ATP-binding protein [Streptomyces albofaciens JCM 4342]